MWAERITQSIAVFRAQPQSLVVYSAGCSGLGVRSRKIFRPVEKLDIKVFQKVAGGNAGQRGKER